MFSYGAIVEDRVHRCHECFERGRDKALLNVGGALKLYCHDEEKSCFNYVLMKKGVTLAGSQAHS